MLLLDASGEISSNDDSGEVSHLPYHPALCAGKHIMSELKRTEDNHEQSSLSCQSGTAGEQPGCRGECWAGRQESLFLTFALPLVVHVIMSKLTNLGLSFPIHQMRCLNQITSKVLAGRPEDGRGD